MSRAKMQYYHAWSATGLNNMKMVLSYYIIKTQAATLTTAHNSDVCVIMLD